MVYHHRIGQSAVRHLEVSYDGTPLIISLPRPRPLGSPRLITGDNQGSSTTVVSYDGLRCRTTVVSYDIWRCRTTVVSCDGPEVSYDGSVVPLGLTKINQQINPARHTAAQRDTPRLSATHRGSPRLTAAHRGSPRPTAAHRGSPASPRPTAAPPPRPTAAHRGSPRLTTAHRGSPQPTATDRGSPRAASALRRDTHSHRHTTRTPGHRSTVIRIGCRVCGRSRDTTHAQIT